MKMFWSEIPVYTEEYLKVINITHEVERVVGESGIRQGTITIYNPHVTSAIAINEPDSELWQDLLNTYKRLVPLKADYQHNAKYKGIPREENAHAHILNTLIGSSVAIPIREGRLLLGTWQAVLFIELDGGKRRRLIVQVVGE